MDDVTFERSSGRETRRPKSLQVAPAAGAAQIRTAGGHPIWPYGNAETLVALTHLAELFDSSVVEVQPSEGIARIRRRCRGVVMSVGAETGDVASLYAHLTNRRFQAARSAVDVERRRPDVLVAPPDSLTPDLLRRLYSHPGWAPGLITGGSREALLRQALLRAAASRLCGQTPGTHVDVNPLEEHGRIDLGHGEMLGGRASPAELSRALGSGSALLTVFTVGDGVDASLGSFVLCPMARKPSGGDAPPPCVSSGNCHRLQLPMADAIDSGRIVAPEAIATRVLVLRACWGIQPASSLYGLMWGYGHRLADHDRVGAMLTTWQVTIGSSSDTGPLARDLARGTRLGTALARFNHASSSRRTGQLMCLLGDPGVRIATRAQPSPALRRSPRRGRSHLDAHQQQLAFLAACVETMVPSEEQKATHTIARDAIAACQRSAWSGLPLAPDDPSGRAMREAVLAFLCRHGTIPAYHWMKLASPAGAKDSSARCLACGQRDREVSFRLRVVGAGARAMHICPRCGLTEDRPAHRGRIGLTIEDGVACLHRLHVQEDWSGALLFRPLVGPNVSRPWPAAKDGRPASRAPIFDGDAQRGPGQVQLFIMEGASLLFARAVSR